MMFNVKTLKEGPSDRFSVAGLDPKKLDIICTYNLLSSALANKISFLWLQ